MKVVSVEGFGAQSRWIQATCRWTVFCLAVALSALFLSADFLDTNTVRFPIPRANHLESIAVGDGITVATGSLSHAVLVSRDGENWSFINFDQKFEPRWVTYGNVRFVLVGGNHIFLSDDGVSWTETGTTTVSLRFVTFTRGQFWAIGGNEIWVSEDGEEWRSIELDVESTGFGLNTLFDDGTMLHALADEYSPSSDDRHVHYTSLDGENWTRQSGGSTVGLHQAINLATDGSVIAATARTPGSYFNDYLYVRRLIFQKADGAVIEIPPPIASVSHWSGVHYRDGRFYFFSNLGIASTDSGFAVWEIDRFPAEYRKMDVIATDEGWLAGSERGLVLFRSFQAGSRDPWETLYEPSVVQTELEDVAFGNGFFLAMESHYGDFKTLLRSVNGNDWERLPREFGARDKLTFVKDRFIILREGSLSFPAEANPIQSVDGTEWSSMEIRSNARVFSVAAGPDLWIALSRAIRGSPVGVFLSSDGTSWEVQDIALPEGTDPITYGNGVFVNTNLVTSDGIDWNLHQRVGEIRFYEREFLGHDGSGVFRSIDGTNWSYENVDVDRGIRDVAKVNGRTVALVEEGSDWRYFSSTGQAFWTKHSQFFRDEATEYFISEIQIVPGWGTVVAIGQSPSMIVQSGSAFVSSRLANLSSRTIVGLGSATQIAGFVIGGSEPTRILARGIGPSLSDFNVGNPIADPMLRLVGESGEIARNDNWADESQVEKEAAFKETGAFPVAPGSLDAALVKELASGRYTVHVNNQGAGSGVALAEIYQLGTDRPLKNLSCRTYVDAGEEAAIGGLVVSGSGIARFLVRAIGPGLADYGVEGILTDPVLQIHRGNTLIASNQGWAEPSQTHLVNNTAVVVGAFPLTLGSADSALVIDLPPGNYTASVRGANGAEGIALLEIYLVE